MPNFRRTGKLVSVAALAASTALSGPVAAVAQDRADYRVAQADPAPEEALPPEADAPVEEAPEPEAEAEPEPEPAEEPEAPVAEEPEAPVVEEPEAPLAEEPASSTEEAPAEPEEPVVEEPVEPAAEAEPEAPAESEAPAEPDASTEEAEPAAPEEEPDAAAETPDEPVEEEPEAEAVEEPAQDAADEPATDTPEADPEPAAEEAAEPDATTTDEPAAADAPADDPATDEAEESEEPAAESAPTDAAPADEPAVAAPETPEDEILDDADLPDPQAPIIETPEEGAAVPDEPAAAEEAPAATEAETPAAPGEQPAGTAAAPAIQEREVGTTEAVTIDASEVQEDNLGVTDSRVQTFNTNNVTYNSVTNIEGNRIETAPEYELPPSAEVVERVGDSEILTILGAGIAGAAAGGLAGYFIASNDDDRLAIGAQETYFDELPDGRIRETVVRQNGVQVVTVTNEYGDIVQRSRILPDGEEVVLFYDPYAGESDREFYYADVGAELPPLELAIPEEEYIVDIAEPDADIYYETIIAPPVETVERIYSVNEVRRSERIRDKVRRIDLNTITFDFGSATISQDEVGNLQALADAISRVVDDNPGETFLIEGHTDAVGSEVANLALSDERAEAVAVALSEFFEIPAENLVTQGYGESDLKVETQEENRENRRVTVRRITALVKPIESVSAN